MQLLYFTLMLFVIFLEDRIDLEEGGKEGYRIKDIKKN